MEFLLHLWRRAGLREGVSCYHQNTPMYAGIARRESLKHAWDAALQGDPESAFGGVLIANAEIDKETASAINELF